MKTPCLGCDKRSATCHGECNEYAEFRKTVECVKKNLLTSKHLNAISKERSDRRTRVLERDRKRRG